MFKKPFKTKSNCQLKSSDRKKLSSRIKCILPDQDEDHEIFNIKDSLNIMKIIAYSGVSVNVYIHMATPILFEVGDVLYPTVYTLWKYPRMLFSFMTHDVVIEKLCNGADLMLPGVVLPANLNQIANKIMKGSPVGVCTDSNYAPVAVGESYVSGRDILNGVRTGRAVKILHTFGDELDKLFDDRPKLPLLTNDPQAFIKPAPSDNQNLAVSSDVINNSNIDESEVEVLTPTDELPTASGSNEKNDYTNDNLTQGQEITELAEDLANQATIEFTSDDIADYCFLKSLLAKKLQLPILANLFYKNFMMDVVPIGWELDIKKTKHKKLSTMLKFMASEGVIQIVDNKGVHSITSVNNKHNLFRDLKTRFDEFRNISTTSEISNDDAECLEMPTEIREDVVVTPTVLTLFGKVSSHTKGSSMPAAEARKLIISYLKTHQAREQTNPNQVTVDSTVCNILGRKEATFEWGDVTSRLLDKMGHCYTIRTSKDRVISGKGKLPLIELSTATRTGNKSVTMVKNLDRYGININEFAKHCQHSLAASTTTHRTSTGVQFQVQGSHKAAICEFLTDRYNVPKKLISGFIERKKKNT